MLTLHRDSRTIVTDESFSVKLKYVNPACFISDVPGDVGLGLEISVNEYTRTEFGNPDRFEKFISTTDRKFPGVSIRFHGVLLMSGTLVITDANEETYSGWLQSQVGVLGAAQRDKNITEMNWKTNVTFENKAVYDPDIDDYCCIEIYNPTFWEGKGFEESVEVPYIDELGNPQTKTIQQTYLTKKFIELSDAIVNKKAEGGTVSLPQQASVITPFLFLNYVVTEIFRMNKMIVEQENNPLNDPDFKLLVYNNYNIIKQIITLSNIDVWTLDPKFNSEYIVEVQQAETIGWEFGTFNYADLIPKISLKDLVLGLQNWLNLAFIFRSDSTVKIINRNDIPGAVPYDLDAYFLGSWRIGEQKNFTLKIIQEPDKNDELNDDWHDLSDRRADFGTPVGAVADLASIIDAKPGELRYVFETNSVYEYKWGVFTAYNADLFENQVDVFQWQLASVAPQPYLYGTAEEFEEIKSGCSILMRKPDSFMYNNRQKGNVSIARSLWADFSLRLMLTDDFAFDKPMGRLAFDTPLGLFETRWKKWAHFWKNRLPVEGEFNMPLNILYYVIDNITQPYRTRHGKFIIEEMEVDFQGDLMGNVKIKGYKLD